MTTPLIRQILSLLAISALGLAPACAHDASGGAHQDAGVTTSTPMPFVVEKAGPIQAPKAVQLAPGTKVTGQGFWKFVVARDVLPAPAGTPQFYKGAHGSLIFDAPRDTVYWGLKGVGFIGFSNKLTQSFVVPGVPSLVRGNIHGADILQRKGKPPLIAAADNEDAVVHITDTTFQRVDDLSMPPMQAYADKKGFAPTDVAFENDNRVWITDGYGKAYFMSADLNPLQYTGKIYGGKAMSQTPHGITYDPNTRALLVSARPEGRIQQWDPKHEHFHAIDGLPPGSTVCDVNVWGDYALAPCLNDTDKTKAGPIFVVNLKKHAVVATLRPKDDLGISDAQSIHSACWYVSGKGKNRELYVIFTNWNPGGIGALKLVNVAE